MPIRGIGLASRLLPTTSVWVCDRDFNYEGMRAYRDLTRSAIVLAVSVLRLGGVVSPIGAGGFVDTLSESVWCQLICNHLISSVCNM
jgi:hypothetical protein